jgi:predicted nucleic acid-binding protein
MITIDTNIAARFLLEDIPDHSERAAGLFERAGAGTAKLYVPASVIIELSYLFTRRLSVPRDRTAITLLDFVQLPGLVIEHVEAVQAALSFWRNHGGLSFVDCYHLALTRQLDMSQIYSFDRKMGGYPGVERIEP